MGSMLQQCVNRRCLPKAYGGNPDSTRDGAEDRNRRRLAQILKFTIHSALQQPQDVDRRSQREFHWIHGNRTLVFGYLKPYYERNTEMNG